MAEMVQGEQQQQEVEEPPMLPIVHIGTPYFIDGSHHDEQLSILGNNCAHRLCIVCLHLYPTIDATFGCPLCNQSLIEFRLRFDDQLNDENIVFQISQGPQTGIGRGDIYKVRMEPSIDECELAYASYPTVSQIAFNAIAQWLKQFEATLKATLRTMQMRLEQVYGLDVKSITGYTEGSNIAEVTGAELKAFDYAMKNQGFNTLGQAHEALPQKFYEIYRDTRNFFKFVTDSYDENGHLHMQLKSLYHYVQFLNLNHFGFIAPLAPPEIEENRDQLFEKIKIRRSMALHAFLSGFRQVNRHVTNTVNQEEARTIAEYHSNIEQQHNELQNQLLNEIDENDAT